MNDKYKELIKFVLDGEEIKARNSFVKRNLNFITTFNKAPLVSLRRTAWKSCLLEWEWFMGGSNYINDLHPSVRHWWTPWVNNNGLIPNNYSIQFRQFVGQDGKTWDQIKGLIEGIKTEPNSRRNVLTTWNTTDMKSPDTPITNCHGSLIQAFVDNKNRLHLTMVQRSADVIVGVPHNWMQYWAFLQWLAYNTDKQVGTLTWLGTDCHIYKEHFELAKEILDTPQQDAPDLIYTPTSEDFLASDFKLSEKYEPLINKQARLIV